MLDRDGTLVPPAAFDRRSDTPVRDSFIPVSSSSFPCFVTAETTDVVVVRDWGPIAFESTRDVPR